MEIRRSLAPANPHRDLKASELKVGFCVNLEDDEGNTETLFVQKITEEEMVFENKVSKEPAYVLILNRAEGDKLVDSDNRTIKLYGQARQYDNGKEL